MESLVQWFTTNLSGVVSREAIVFIISMISILELRGGLLAASLLIEKYEFWGLVLFVGIPLPGTGAWTGALIASLLGIKFKKAFPAILLGIALASVIMTILSFGVLGKIVR